MASWKNNLLSFLMYESERRVELSHQRKRRHTKKRKKTNFPQFTKFSKRINYSEWDRENFFLASLTLFMMLRWQLLLILSQLWHRSLGQKCVRMCVDVIGGCWGAVKGKNWKKEKRTLRIASVFSTTSLLDISTLFYFPAISHPIFLQRVEFYPSTVFRKKKDRVT